MNTAGKIVTALAAAMFTGSCAGTQPPPSIAGAPSAGTSPSMPAAAPFSTAGSTRPTFAPAAAGAASDPSYQGEAVETFLSDARIVRVRSLSEGVTAPRRATLERDGMTHDAVFKTIEYLRPGVTQLDDGTVVSNMEDNWRFEVAAYRIDRMIGLGLVPATVQREYRGTRGSLQWWVDSRMSEAERRRGNIEPPDREAWERQQLKMFLFDNLLFNWDRHLNNILITDDFQIILIDHSRAFLGYSQIRREADLTRFSRSLLAGIEALTRDNLRQEVGRYLDGSKIDALLKRRDRILELARDAIAQRGEAAVLYP